MGNNIQCSQNNTDHIHKQKLGFTSSYIFTTAYPKGHYTQTPRFNIFRESQTPQTHKWRH